jgi:hypothetical protein
MPSVWPTDHATGHRRGQDSRRLVGPDHLTKRIYHYTSADGLLGIIGSGHLRATDLRYLNDTSELHFGLTEMLSVYETISQVPGRGESVVDQLAKLYSVPEWQSIGPVPISAVDRLPRERFDPVAKAMVDSLEGSIVIGVACFCGKGDLLSQWRGYGIGGYAIGFDAHDLRKLGGDRYLPLTRVLYGRPQVRQIMRSVSARANELLDAGAANLHGSLVREKVTLPLLGYAAQIKHPTFISEEELRIGDVAPHSKSELWKFREGDLGVVPYLEIDLRHADTGLLPIREIYLAPGPEVELRETAVRALLRSRGYDVTGRNPVRVQTSRIPFRG